MGESSCMRAQEALQRCNAMRADPNPPPVPAPGILRSAPHHRICGPFVEGQQLKSLPISKNSSQLVYELSFVHPLHPYPAAFPSTPALRRASPRVSRASGGAAETPRASVPSPRTAEQRWQTGTPVKKTETRRPASRRRLMVAPSSVHRSGCAARQQSTGLKRRSSHFRRITRHRRHHLDTHVQHSECENGRQVDLPQRREQAPERVQVRIADRAALRGKGCQQQ